MNQSGPVSATAQVPVVSHSLPTHRTPPARRPFARDARDADLARALAAGDAWAMRETWRRFAPGIMVFAGRALGRRSDAEDVAQEVFHEVFTKVGILREPDRLRSFVFAFAVRVVRSELRRRRRRAWLSVQQPETLVDLGTEVMDVEARDLLRRFHVLLDRLAPRHRLVFALRYLESMR
jgi:RNA polymerase sigma factor (sigma-70 family)